MRRALTLYPIQYRSEVEISGLSIELCQSNYLNNIVEQDHLVIKRRVRPMIGFKRFHTARRLIAGIESMHMIAKRQMLSPSGQEAASTAQQSYSLAFCSASKFGREFFPCALIATEPRRLCS